VAALLWLVADRDLIDFPRVAERLGSIFEIGSTLSTDPSYIERARQAGVAMSTFSSSPLTGVGLGHRFEWITAYGQFYSTYNMDTGLTIAAKFGLLGMLLLGVAVASAVSFYRRLPNQGTDWMRFSFVGFAAISVATLPLGNPLEDKGFALASAILLAWAFARVRPELAQSARPAQSYSRLTSYTAQRL
jgi:hypothetical protein